MKHLQKPLFIVFLSFVIIKFILLAVGFFGILDLTGIFAQTPPVELNSTNIIEAPFSCLTGSIVCNLRNKNIWSIAVDTFINHTLLQTLRLETNFISSIESGTFNGLTNLENLFLHSNSISSIGNGAFNGLTNLIQLRLDTNSISIIESGTFNGLTNLETLHLANNPIVTIGHWTFNLLNKVKTLRLEWIHLSCLFSWIFMGLDNLQALFLSNSHLSTIEVWSFIWLDKLETLRLQNTKPSTLESWAFIWLKNLKSLYLGQDVNNNYPLHILKQNAFQWLTNLTYLSFVNRNIQNIEPGAFVGLEKIENLDLSQQNIHFLYSWTFQWLSWLLSLWLEENIISHIEPWAFDWLHSIQKINLWWNRLYNLYAWTFSWLSQNNTSSKIFYNIELYGNEIVFIESGTFHDTLESLVLRDNLLTHLQYWVFNTIGTNSIQLHNNEIARIDDRTFSWVWSTTTSNFIIELNNNRITSLWEYAFWWFIDDWYKSIYLYNNPILSIYENAFSWFALWWLDIYNNCTRPHIWIIYNYNHPNNIAQTDEKYCTIIDDTTSENDYIDLLLDRSYVLWNHIDSNLSSYYAWILSLRFLSWSEATILAPTIMKYTNHLYLRWENDYYRNHIEIQYESWTKITSNTDPFIWIIHWPSLFVTWAVPNLFDVISVMRFWALTHRINFSQPVTIKMPAPWKNEGDIVYIYSSDKENIYDRTDPEFVFEKTGVVVYKTVMVDWSLETRPYVEFTTYHASRWVLWSPGCWNVVIEDEEECDTINLNNKNCTDFWFNQWNLQCSASCVFDTSACFNPWLWSSGGGWGGWGPIPDNCKVPSSLPCANKNGIDYSPGYYDATCCISDIKEGIHRIHPSAPICDISDSKYSQEINDAFQRAYGMWLTNRCPIDVANLNNGIRRDEAAKIISLFAKQVLDIQPDTKKSACTKFKDIKHLSLDLQNYVILSCQLGIMGYESDGIRIKKTFDPSYILNRAQFGTMLSRLLYGNTYNVKVWDKEWFQWYEKHHLALHKNNIIKNINKPFDKERRWRVILMLYRAFHTY